MYEVCCYVFKNKNLFSRNDTEHLYATRARHNFLPDSHKRALYQRGLFYNGCKLFNALPVHIKLTSTLPTFKNKLKDYLLTKNSYRIDDFY